MPTWANFRDNTVRYLLRDTGSTKRWSDAELLQYVNWAIADLSRVVPELKSMELTGSGPSFTLPEDFQTINRVTLVDSAAASTFFVPKLDLYDDSEWPFAAPDDDTSPWGYLLDWPSEGSIYITRLKDAGTYTLYYYAVRAELSADNAVLPFGRQRWTQMALACYICYVAHLRQGVSRANLEQYAQRPDLPVGNPLNVEAREWLVAYNRLLAEHRDR
jgi:hypothetical protein